MDAERRTHPRTAGRGHPPAGGGAGTVTACAKRPERPRRSHRRPAPPRRQDPAGPQAPERSTTHLAAADESGLAVNITQTLGSSYGSGVVIGRTGIAMNNGHHWCTLIPGDRKELKPGKRRESPTSPVHAFGLHGAPIGPSHSFGIDPL